MRRDLVELLDGVTVVQRIDHVRPGRLVEGLDQFAQTFGMLCGDVDRLREVGSLLMQGPVVEIDLVAFSLQRHRHPAVAPVGPVGPALVVLLAAHRVGGFAAHDLGQARAVHRQGVFAVRSGKRRDAGQIEQGRHDVGDMGKLGADGAGVGDLFGPGDDEADPPPAPAGIGLEGRKGRVADLAPAHRIERRDFTAADLFALREIGLERQRRQAGKAPVEIDIAVGAGRTCAAVVGREHDEGVVEFAHLGEQRDQLADVLVDAVEHRGIGFHVPHEVRTLIGGQAVPGGHLRVAWRERRVRGHQAQRLLACEPLRAHHIPAGLIAATVLGEVGLFGLKRAMDRIEGQVKKEGFVGMVVARLSHKAHAVVGPVVGGVVVGRVLVDWGEGVVVDDACREEIAGLAFHEAIELVEAALAWPALIGRGAVGRVVPFADADGGVAAGPKRFGDGGCGQRHVARIAWKAGIVGGQPAGGHRMRIASGEQGRTRRRADRMRGVVVKAQAAGGNRVDIGCLDLGAIAAEIGIAHVVHVDDDDVGAAGLGLRDWLPPRLGGFARAADAAFKAGISGGVA